ncbi:MAG TPA: ABC transporter permease [Vicinamibacterales bacterium]|nr:ABC transporter permease [Vicinamibacterales bacterium]
MRRIRFLIWKELIELGQDPRLFGIVVLAPILQLFMLAYAATTDVRNVPIVVADADRSSASRELVSRFEASPTFTVTQVFSSPNEVDAVLERGEAWMALIVPRGFGAALAGGQPQAVQIVADGSDANSAGVSMSYATSLIAAYGQEIAARASMVAGRDGSAGASIQPVVRVWFNPRLESRDFMIPGIVAVLLLVVTTNLSSMGIVREKELGTLEQLNVTPLTRAELILGKLLPYGMVGLIDVVLVLSVAIAWFHVPMRGSYVLLFALTLVYLVSTLGLGLFVSTISNTQQQAMMTTTFFFLIPMMLLSGFVFPIENMPAAIQAVTYLIPLRYFLVILRSIFLKGVGLETLWPQALALAGWGVGILLLAIARSSKRSA